jgi:hypothetical protein
MIAALASRLDCSLFRMLELSSEEFKADALVSTLELPSNSSRKDDWH